MNLMNNSFYKRILVISNFFLYIGVAHGANTVDFSSYPQGVNVTVEYGGSVSRDAGNSVVTQNASALYYFSGANSATEYQLYEYKRPLAQMPDCGTNQPTSLIDIANLNKTLIYSSGPYGKKWKFLTGAAGSNNPRCGNGFTQGCRAPDGTIWGQRFNVCPFGDGAINPPIENPDSICNLNSQSLNLNYSTTSLAVSGLTQTTNLVVSCSSGTPHNYQLKLTGTNVTNGRLNFNNGVSAQVYLNGVLVQANGPGIQLNSLTSRTIPVRATLTGTAATSGVSSTTGILVLEAL